MGVGKADRSGLSASSPKKNRLKSFVVEAAISSSWRWDKIMSSCPPLLKELVLIVKLFMGNLHQLIDINLKISIIVE
jgi:hypothetical protein